MYSDFLNGPVGLVEFLKAPFGRAFMTILVGGGVLIGIFAFGQKWRARRRLLAMAAAGALFAGLAVALASPPAWYYIGIGIAAGVAFALLLDLGTRAQLAARAAFWQTVRGGPPEWTIRGSLIALAIAVVATLVAITSTDRTLLGIPDYVFYLVLLPGALGTLAYAWQQARSPDVSRDDEPDVSHVEPAD